MSSSSFPTEPGEAHLDPWCLVPLENGVGVLFGYAHGHPVTGGLAWLSSSEVLELDRQVGTAKTRSGRDYRLGRCFEPLDVGAETAEGRLAFELLLGAEFADMDTLREIDRTWLSACKAARHLGVPMPPRTGPGVGEFVKSQMARYLQLRRGTS